MNIIPTTESSLMGSYLIASFLGSIVSITQATTLDLSTVIDIISKFGSMGFLFVVIYVIWQYLAGENDENKVQIKEQLEQLNTQFEKRIIDLKDSHERELAAKDKEIDYLKTKINQ